MGECLERFFAVITAHATGAHTAERDIRVGQMHYSVVDTSAAVGNISRDEIFACR